MKKLFYVWISLGAVFLMTACTSPDQQAGTSSAPSTVREYRTYSVEPLPTQGPSSDPSAAARMNDVARSAITESLAAKGFSEVAPAQADFIVKVETEFYQDPIFESSEKRHVRLSFNDRQNKERIWSAQIGRSSSRTLEPDLLREAVVQMLAPLPAAPLKK